MGQRAARDLAWIDVTPPSMSMQNDGGGYLHAIRPANGGAVWEKNGGNVHCLIASDNTGQLGTVKPMVDGTGSISG